MRPVLLKLPCGNSHKGLVVVGARIQPYAVVVTITVVAVVVLRVDQLVETSRRLHPIRPSRL